MFSGFSLAALLPAIGKALLDWRVICVAIFAALLWVVDVNAEKRGAAEMLNRWQAAELAAAEAARLQDAGEDAHAADVSAEVSAALAGFREGTEKLLGEIRAHVTTAVDDRFPVPCGLVRLHDAAALGLDPAEVAACAGQPDDAVASVRASRFAETVARNYGRCLGEAERVRQWQRWYEDLRKGREPPRP